MRDSTFSRDADRRPWPRPLAIIAGLWLFLTAFLWPHSPAAFANDLAVGGLIVVVGLASLRIHVLRFAHLALAVWLLVSLFVFQRPTALTFWHDLVIALFVAAVSLVPGEGRDAAPRGRYGHPVRAADVA